MPRKVAQKRDGLVYAPPGADLSHIMPDLRKTVVETSCLLLDPKNPRRGNVELVASSLSEFGQQKTPIIYKFPGDSQYTVIAGNHTTRASLFEIKDKADKKFPTPWKYLAVSEFVGTPKEAQEFALMDNRSSDVATYDDTVLSTLLKTIKDESGDDGESLRDKTGYSNEDLTYLLSQVQDDEDEEEAYTKEDWNDKTVVNDNGRQVDKELAGDTQVTTKLNTFAYYKSDNKWGIPNLLPNMLADPPDKPIKTFPGAKYMDKDWEHDWFLVWGWSTKGCPYDKSILAFYTDDSAFENLWVTPGKFATNFSSQKIKAIVTPDYSMYEFHPFAERLYNAYRERWMGRFFQEAELKVIPNVGGGRRKIDNEIVYSGVPRNTPCVAMQIQTNLKKNKPSTIDFYLKSVKHMLKTLSPQSLILYASKTGHEVTWNEFPSSLHVIRVATVQDVRRYNYEPDPLSSIVKSYKKKKVDKTAKNI